MRFKRIKFELRLRFSQPKICPVCVTKLIIRTETTTLNSFAKVGLCEER